MAKCRKCGADTENPPVTISLGADTRMLRLCEKDIRSVRRLFDLAGETPKAGAGEPVPKRSRHHEVIPID